MYFPGKPFCPVHDLTAVISVAEKEKIQGAKNRQFWALAVDALRRDATRRDIALLPIGKIISSFLALMIVSVLMLGRKSFF